MEKLLYSLILFHLLQQEEDIDFDADPLAIHTSPGPFALVLPAPLSSLPESMMIRSVPEHLTVQPSSYMDVSSFVEIGSTLSGSIYGFRILRRRRGVG